MLLLATIAHAEPTLTLQQAMTEVVARNPDKKSAELAQAIAAIEARRARLDQYTAQVTASAGTEAGVLVPWQGEASTYGAASWGARATVGVPIYAGGANKAAIDAADARSRASELDTEIAERSLVRAAYTAYWTIKGYELQIAAAQEGLDFTQQALDIIVAKADAGLAAGIDVNRSKVDLIAQQESLVEQKAALYQAEQELLRLLHMTGDGVTLTDDPPAPSTEPVLLPLPQNVQRPELLRQNVEAAEADAAVRAARAGALPTVGLTGTLGVGSTDSDTFDADLLGPSLDASVGLSVSWNPFDLFQTRDAVAEARLSEQQIGAAQDSEATAIHAEIKKAGANVQQLRERAPLVDAQVALARDNLQIVQGLYAQGSATILDLFDAQSAFRQARTAGASLRVELAIAEYDLRWLAGENLTGASR